MGGHAGTVLASGMIGGQLHQIRTHPGGGPAGQGSQELDELHGGQAAWHGFGHGGAVGGIQHIQVDADVGGTLADAAQIALEACLDYVKDRVTFGKPLAKHQVIRHKLAEMATRIDVAREYAYRCAARMDAGQNIVKEVSMAKNFATDVADFVTYEAVQIFGGMGYMRESVVERLYRDNRILSIGGGTHEIMNEIIGKQLGL